MLSCCIDIFRKYRSTLITYVYIDPASNKISFEMLTEKLKKVGEYMVWGVRNCLCIIVNSRGERDNGWTHLYFFLFLSVANKCFFWRISLVDLRTYTIRRLWTRVLNYWTFSHWHWYGKNEHVVTYVCREESAGAGMIWFRCLVSVEV